MSFTVSQGGRGGGGVAGTGERLIVGQGKAGFSDGLAEMARPVLRVGIRNSSPSDCAPQRANCMQKRARLFHV